MKSEDFQSYAKDWWDPNGPLWTLHAINPIRANFIQSVIGPVKNQKIADIGCGAGLLTETLSRQNAQVTGVDSGEKLISIAKTHATLSQLNIHYLHQDAETFLNDRPQQYDAIVLFELLEHIQNPENIIKLIRNQLKPNGILFISTINRTAISFFSTIIAAEYLLNWVPQGTHRYDWFLKPSEIISLCEHHHLQHISSKGLSYNPLTQSFSLSTDMSINFFLAFKHVTL